MFRHYCVILKELVVCNLPSYTSVSNKVTGITQYHTPTNALVYHIFKTSLKSFTLKHSYCSDMFRQRIACHPQGALMVLAQITIKHGRSSSVRGVAAYL